MVDYTTHNSGVSGKGILIAFVAIIAFVVLLAVLGTNTVPTDADGTVPAAVPEAVPAAPAATD
jgi:hypothetical protein